MFKRTVVAALVTLALLAGGAHAQELTEKQDFQMHVAAIVSGGFYVGKVDGNKDADKLLSFPRIRAGNNMGLAGVTVFQNGDADIVSPYGNRVRVRLSPEKLDEIKDAIRSVFFDDYLKLVRAYVKEKRRDPSDKSGFYAKLDGKTVLASWYRGSEDKGLQSVDDFCRRLKKILDAAAKEGLAEPDRELVDAEIQRWQIHKGIPDVDPIEVNSETCVKCHDTSLKQTPSLGASRFNKWAFSGLAEVLVREDFRKPPFVQWMFLRTKKDGVNQPLRGRVINAHTNAPVKEFRIIGGTKDDRGRLICNPRTVAEFNDELGRFEREVGWSQTETHARIEAHGYYSEPILTKNATYFMRLRPAAPKKFFLVTPDQSPVENAVCGLATRDQLACLLDGKIAPRTQIGSELADRWLRSKTVLSDARGFFEVPRPNETALVVATHPDHGLAFGWTGGLQGIQFVPWSGLSGVVKQGEKRIADANVTVTAVWLDVFDRNWFKRVPYLREVFVVKPTVVTNQSGSWKIPRLPSGVYQVQAEVDGKVIAETRVTITSGRTRAVALSSNTPKP